VEGFGKRVICVFSVFFRYFSLFIAKSFGGFRFLSYLCTPMKRRLKYILGIVTAVVVLLAALPMLVYVPPVQQWLVDTAAKIASEETGLDISVEEVSLKFPLDLRLEGVTVRRKTTDDGLQTSDYRLQTSDDGLQTSDYRLQTSDDGLQTSDYRLQTLGDTIAYVKRAVVDVELLPLLKERAVVKGLALETVQLNTFDLISDVQVMGRLEQLTLGGSSAHWGIGDVRLGEALLSDADMTVLLSDTAATDTTVTEPTLWRIALERLTIDNTHVAVHLPGDSLVVSATLAHAEATKGDINLADEQYGVGRLTLRRSELTIDNPYEPEQARGMDMNHLALSEIDIEVDSIYYKDPMTRLAIRHVAMKERSGLQLTELNGLLTLDAAGIRAPATVVKTPYSTLFAKTDIDYGSFATLTSGAHSEGAATDGQMHVEIDANVGREDLLTALLTAVPEGDTPTLPQWPLTVKGKIDGNMAHATISQFVVDLPTALHAEARGSVGFTPDDNNQKELLDRLQAGIGLQLKMQQVDFALRVAGIDRQTLTIPSWLNVEGTVTADDRRYTADLTAHDPQGEVRAKGRYDMATDSYQADIDLTHLDVSRYVPAIVCSMSNVECTLEGHGTDPLSKQSRVEGEVHIGQLHYDGWDLDSLQLNGTLTDGHAMVDLISANHLADGTACIDARISHDQIDATVTTDLQCLNMQAVGAADHELFLKMNADFKVSTDLKSNHKLSGLAKDITLYDSLKTFHPEPLGVLLNLRPDTTYARIQNGNFIVKMDASGSYDQLINTLLTLNDTLISLDARRIIDQPLIKRLLPTGRLYVTSGNNNTLADMLRAAQNIVFRDLLVDITTSPESGINGQAHLYGLNADSTLIDTIQVTLKESNHGLTFQSRMANNRHNPQMVFTALADGHLYEHGLRIGLRLFDKEGKMSLRLGTQAAMENDGMRFTLLPKDPTLGYRVFQLNADNYIFLRKDQRLMAKVDLIADNGTGIKVYSEETGDTEDTGAAGDTEKSGETEPSGQPLQDLTVSVHRLDLKELTTALPFMPHIAGVLDGDFHTIMDQQRQISVAGDIRVATMAYEGSRIGDLNTEFVYLQREDDSHAIDGTLTIDGYDVASLSGSYINKKVSDGHERIDGLLTLEHTPLSLVNGFIPDQLMELEGFVEGELNLAGSLSRPQIDGELVLDSAFLVSRPYGVRLRFDRDPVEIEQSKVQLNNFAIYAYNDNALNMQGSLDFSDPANMNIDVRMQARNFMLINSKQTIGSLVFGKGFVNCFAMLRGTTNRLSLRGRLDVLGTTDLTYLLLDSPLSTDNGMEELVRFTDFSDTTQTVVQRPVPNGIDMDLRISIDQGAHVKCGLNADQTNYVDLFGGGDLRMRFNDSDELQLSGRYTVSSGTMKYSMPVIPLKTFIIHEDSYVEFTGDPMNPTLNITATERTKAAVTQEDGTSRSISFDCGVVITKTLNDMGLQFTISAPEDMAVQSELASLSAEHRGKLAVTMLTTGMYLADGNTSSFSMNSALSSFLQSEINQITGNALKTLDLNVGMDNTTDASGQVHTDYSFSFAKRFWNNRLKVQIGGKVSSGQEAARGQQQSFFDNVTMEYRLSPTSNQYLKLFYKENVYDWLEGYTGEYGGGYMWKRKMDHWWEMFRMKAKPATTMPMPRRTANDSITTKTIATE
jgi:hypothetical protein